MGARALTWLGIAGLLACLAAAGWRHHSMQRAQDVAAFSLDKTEVSVAAYRACVTAGACREPASGKFCNFGVAGRDADPVNCVTRAQAAEYCAWAGRRLPTRDEWVRAACGSERHDYSFAERLSPEVDCLGRHDVFTNEGAVSKLVTPAKGTCPVDAHPKGASAQGVLGLAGNVSEWTSSEPVRGQSNRSIHMGANWIMRGSGDDFRCDRETAQAPVYQDSLIGFRCAMDGSAQGFRGASNVSSATTP